jgi:nucleotide-binding universal stress UspA family protein
MDEIKKILVPVDFSENSKKILQDALTKAGQLNAKVMVVYVVEGLENYGGLSIPHISLAEFEKELVQSATKKMESFLEENMDPSVAHESKILHGDIVEKINTFAESEGVDMIIMGTHGYKGLEKVLFGSVAERVVKTAPCPVLTINPYK